MFSSFLIKNTNICCMFHILGKWVHICQHSPHAFSLESWCAYAGFLSAMPLSFNFPCIRFDSVAKIIECGISNQRCRTHVKCCDCGAFLSFLFYWKWQHVLHVCQSLGPAQRSEPSQPSNRNLQKMREMQKIFVCSIKHAEIM